MINASAVCARGEQFRVAFPVLVPVPLQPGSCLPQPNHGFN